MRLIVKLLSIAITTPRKNSRKCYPETHIIFIAQMYRIFWGEFKLYLENQIEHLKQ